VLSLERIDVRCVSRNEWDPPTQSDSTELVEVLRRDKPYGTNVFPRAKKTNG